MRQEPWGIVLTNKKSWRLFTNIKNVENQLLIRNTPPAVIDTFTNKLDYCVLFILLWLLSVIWWSLDSARLWFDGEAVSDCAEARKPQSRHGSESKTQSTQEQRRLRARKKDDVHLAKATRKSAGSCLINAERLQRAQRLQTCQSPTQAEGRGASQGATNHHHIFISLHTDSVTQARPLNRRPVTSITTNMHTFTLRMVYVCPNAS